MKKLWLRRYAAAALALVMLTGSASALFGRQRETAEPAVGAPIARDVAIRTYRDIPYEAQFLASDSEGDDMTFQVVTEPKKGTVSVDGVNFTYTPEKGATGGDSFTYTATDSAGNVSCPATVSVTIDKTRSGVAYADMEGNPAASAAQCLAEEGIFTGAKIGENWYFEPERPVSRSEFLAMVLEAAGREVTAVTMTGFSDDAAIPVWAKAYAAAGVADGIVQGKAGAEGSEFRGAEAISYNEAATVLNRVLDLGDVDLDVWYADRETVPSWAAQAVGNMEAVSVLRAGSFGSGAMAEAVTRSAAAQMLTAARTLLQGEEPKSLLDLLK